MIRDLAKRTLSFVGLSWLPGLMWHQRLLATCRLPETSAAGVDRKAQGLRELANRNAFGRTIIWRELARLERVRGNELIASMYALRAIRLTGDDGVAPQLPWVLESLHRQGYEREATMAEALYGTGSVEESYQRCRDLLSRAYSEHRSGPPADYEFLDDRRGETRCRAAIIVSMYNAAPKLRLFLDTLLEQTLIRRCEIEFVFVDSASPTDECALLRTHPIYESHPILYARTRQRETIQQAWNRGIDLARAPLLAMLGVDEGATSPRCLEVLTQELEADPSLDWVQASALVTEVDEQGHWLKDCFTYDRGGHFPGCESLDPSYLSYVGSMLRRSLHERHGYYDPSFRGGGDGEFMLRVLPLIRVKMLPETLGLFRNYPDPRMTSHPRVELEALRAWYAHRTRAGIEYAWNGRPLEAVRILAERALQYRRADSARLRSNSDFAAELARYLMARGDTSPWLKDAEGLLKAFRRYDSPPQGTLHQTAFALHRASREIECIRQRFRSLWPDKRIDYFRDDRNELFKTVWPSDP